MKLILFLAVGAFAVQDTAPPVISLNLNEMKCSDSTDCTRTGSTKCALHSKCRTTEQDTKDCSSETATCNTRQSMGMVSSSSYARKCEYIPSTAAFGDRGQKACPSPTAYAYDHNEGAIDEKITVSCTKFVISEPDKAPVRAVKDAASSECQLAKLSTEAGVEKEVPCGTTYQGSTCKLANAEYQTRGEDVLVYSVKDLSGNEAEKLVFAMIIEDTAAPVFTYDKGSKVTLKACRHGTSISSRCEYNVQGSDWQLDTAGHYDTAPKSAGLYGPFDSQKAANDAAVANSETGKFQNVLKAGTTGAGNTVKNHDLPTDPTGAQSTTRWFTYRMTDWADIFGKNNVDNIGYRSLQVVTEDKDKPRVQLIPLKKPDGSTGVTQAVNGCNQVKTISDLVIGTTTVTVNTISSCRLYNREHYVEPWDGLLDARPFCYGCAGNTCYEECVDCNSPVTCEPADITEETIECQHTLADAVNTGDTEVAQWSKVADTTNGTFVNTGAYCTDDLKSAASNGENTGVYTPEAFATETTLDVGAVGTYAVTYTCKDSDLSNTRTRSVKVVDTTQPEVATTTQRMEELNTEDTDLDKYRAGDGKGADAAAADAALSCNDDVAHGTAAANCTTLKKADLASRLGTGTMSTYAENLMQLQKIQWSAGFHGDGAADSEALAVLGEYDSYDAETGTGAHGGYKCTDTCFNEWNSQGEEKAWTASTDGTNAGHASMWVQCKGTTDCCDSIDKHHKTAWGTAANDDFEEGDAASASKTGILKFSKTFKSSEKGHWALLYTCNDGYTAPVMGCRTVTVEDHTKPVITILGEDETSVEASKEENYVDQGADCYDQIDKNIADKVQVSGDVVNLSRVGTYVITYSCKDTAGNSADPAERKVIVQDTTCPYCKFEANSAEITLEAGFKYVDNARFDCDDGKTDHDLKCYDAYLGTSASDNCLPASVTARDYLPEWADVDSEEKPDVDYTTNDDGIDMNSQGVFPASSTWGGPYHHGTFPKYGLASLTGTYLLQYTTTDETGNKNYGWKDNSCKPAELADESVNQAETNKPATPNGDVDYNRIVKVVDTLRPVIKLQLDNKLVQKGTVGTVDAGSDYVEKQQSAAGGTISATTIEKEHTDAGFMSEQAQTSVNGWVLGAIASAVSGLALLGYSLRKQTQPVATSVPV